ncbi:MAG: calcium-binding protein [bacterium]
MACSEPLAWLRILPWPQDNLPLSAPNGGFDTIPTGTHTITAFVDDVNRFAESDETNNQLSQSITVSGCRGRVANIWVSNNTIFGGPDSGRPYTGTLRGTNDDDVIVGTDANDSINGAGGNDIICGGAGRDTLRGGQGNDRLFGESGNDRLFGGSGGDFCNGGEGRDKVSDCERLK